MWKRVHRNASHVDRLPSSGTFTYQPRLSRPPNPTCFPTKAQAQRARVATTTIHLTWHSAPGACIPGSGGWRALMLIRARLQNIRVQCIQACRHGPVSLWFDGHERAAANSVYVWRFWGAAEPTAAAARHWREFIRPASHWPAATARHRYQSVWSTRAAGNHGLWPLWPIDHTTADRERNKFVRPVHHCEHSAASYVWSGPFWSTWDHQYSAAATCTV